MKRYFTAILGNGIICAIMSSLTFSIMNVLVKATSSRIPSNEIVFFRSIIGTLIILYLMRRDRVPFSRTGVSLLFMRGCCGALFMIAYFYTIANMPLIDANILVNLSPVFSFIFSAILLKDCLPSNTWLVLPVVVTGAILTINPFAYTTYSVVALWGIAAAVFSALAGIFIRYLSRSFHAFEIILYFMATATLISIPLMWNQFVIPDALELFFLICLGVISLLAQVFLTKAFTHENAVVVEIVRYIGIIFNAFWGFAFWMEVPAWNIVLGGILIVGGCIMLTLNSKKQAIGQEVHKTGSK